MLKRVLILVAGLLPVVSVAAKEQIAVELLSEGAFSKGEGMHPELVAQYEKVIERINTFERARRVDYYEYLKKQRRAEATLEEHLSRFAAFARFGKPADVMTLDALSKLSGPPLPDSLREFYLTQGSFDGGGMWMQMKIHEPAALVECARPDPEQPGNLVRSLGVAHMIRWSWGGDRPEFDPQSGEGLSAVEADILNREYSVIGWISSDGYEANRYLYFDAHGKYGLLYYHQDGFRDFYAEELKPMLAGRGGTLTFDEAMQQMLVHATTDLEELLASHRR